MFNTGPLHILSALPGTEVCIYFFVFLSILTPQITILYPQSVSVFTKVRFGPFRSVLVPRESVSVLRESVSVSTKVRFGLFRSVLVPRESVSVLRESVSVSTKVRFGPFRSVSVNRDTGMEDADHALHKFKYNDRLALSSYMPMRDNGVPVIPEV